LSPPNRSGTAPEVNLVLIARREAHLCHQSVPLLVFRANESETQGRLGNRPRVKPRVRRVAVGSDVISVPLALHMLEVIHLPKLFPIALLSTFP
jgi:hypothetical protein